jgi:CheY-like chemotaxis protein
MDPDTSRSTGRTLAILVVDDEPLSRMVVSSLLRRAGHEVDTAIDGIEAVEAASRREYDLVLMDLQMPELDGFEASRRIRASGPGGAKAPIGTSVSRIVALTATLDDDVRARCVDAGIDDVVEKPLDATRVEAILSELPVGTAPAGVESELEELSVEIFSRLRRETAAHLSRPFEEVVEGILATLRELVALMRYAAATGDRATFARYAHTLGGSAATLGASLLRERLRELEITAVTLAPEQLETAALDIESRLDRVAHRVGEELDRTA